MLQHVRSAPLPVALLPLLSDAAMAGVRSHNQGATPQVMDARLPPRSSAMTKSVMQLPRRAQLSVLPRVGERPLSVAVMENASKIRTDVSTFLLRTPARQAWSLARLANAFSARPNVLHRSALEDKYHAPALEIVSRISRPVLALLRS